MRSAQFREGRAPTPYEAAKNSMRLFPTPRASDSNGTGPAGSKSAEHDRTRGQLRGYVLYPTVSTGAGLCGGSGNFAQLQALRENGVITETERKSMSQGNGGKLNPDWVEWLMGFPCGWTDIEGTEDEATHPGWAQEPDVPRLTEKKGYRADRIKCLGNAVVPQWAYPIFRAIAEEGRQ